MSPQTLHYIVVSSWAFSGLGVGLWVWGMLAEKEPVRKLRFSDCGVVLLFASVILRIICQQERWGVFDWAMLVLGPLFIAAALWRLWRTGQPQPNSGE